MQTVKKLIIMLLMAIGSNTLSNDLFDGKIPTIGKPHDVVVNPGFLISNEILKFNIDFQKLQDSAKNALAYIQRLPDRLKQYALAYWKAYQDKRNLQNDFNNAWNSVPQPVGVNTAPVNLPEKIKESGNIIASVFKNGLNFIYNNKGKIALLLTTYYATKKVREWWNKKKSEETNGKKIVINVNYQGDNVNADTATLTEKIQNALNEGLIKI